MCISEILLITDLNKYSIQVLNLVNLSAYYIYVTYIHPYSCVPLEFILSMNLYLSTECVLNPTPSNIEASKKDPSEEEIAQALRVCKDCYELMEKHMSRVKEETSKPMVVQLYEVF